MSLVVEEHLLHAQRHRAVVEEDVRLEIVLEATEIDIGRTAGAERIIADEEFAVVESGGVEQHLHAGFERLHDV